MGFGTLLQGFLLLTNALAILNEDRFLTPRGLSFEATPGKRQSLKQRTREFIYVAQYLRLPLILLNIVTIILKLISG